MNENLKMGPQGLRLLMDFEKGDDSVPLSENGAALAPYVCPGDELTIGYGCTHWFDGEPVQIHHRLEGEADALQLLMHNLTSYEDCVRGALTREATQNQFDGMTCLCFNIGKGAFLDSSVLKSFNAGRMEDAAAAFGLWTGSTTARPRRSQINDADYAPKLKQNHKGIWCWIGPEGQYCSYMLRLDGLLYRHYAEALLFMSRNWTRTLRSSTAMELVLTPTDPAEADWDAGKGRWIDRVRYRTPFKDVYAAAYDDRLDVLAAPAPQPAPVPQTAPAATGDSAKPSSELVLTKDMQQPAAIPSAAEKAKEGAVVETPASAAAPSPVSVSKPEPAKPSNSSGQVSASSPEVAAASPPGSAAPLPKLDPPKPPPVIAPKSIDVRTIPYGDVKPENGAKNMTDSTRVIGLVIVALGSVVQVLAGREIVSSTIGAVFYDLSRDTAFVAVAAGAIALIFGWLTRKRGTHVLARGMINATQVLK